MSFKAQELNLNDIVTLNKCDDDTQIFKLDIDSYVEALRIGIEFDGVELDDDFISSIGFNVMMFKGVQTYILRYEDVMLTATFSEDETFIGYAVINSLHYDTENDKAIVDVVEGIRPLVYVHELQALLRVYGYREFADGIDI